MLKPNQVLLLIGNDVFECRRFIGSHPGEGINNIYLKEWNRKNVTEQFEQYHYTDTPTEWINEAKLIGVSSEGIRYVGPIASFFHSSKRIPEWFIYFQKGEELDEFVAQPQYPNNTFFVTNRDEKSVLLVRKTDGGVQKTILKKGDKGWSSSEGEGREEKLFPTLEELVASLTTGLSVI